MVNDTTLLLNLAGASVIRVERLEDGTRRVHLATADASARACPVCGVFASRVKGAATTRPRDLPYEEHGLEFDTTGPRTPPHRLTSKTRLTCTPCLGSMRHRPLPSLFPLALRGDSRCQLRDEYVTRRILPTWARTGTDCGGMDAKDWPGRRSIDGAPHHGLKRHGLRDRLTDGTASAVRGRCTGVPYEGLASPSSQGVVGLQDRRAPRQSFTEQGSEPGTGRPSECHQRCRKSTPEGALHAGRPAPHGRRPPRPQQGPNTSHGR